VIVKRRQKRLSAFTWIYGQLALVFPLLVAAPRYFARQIMLGSLMQTAPTFGQVQGAFWSLGSAGAGAGNPTTFCSDRLPSSILEHVGANQLTSRLASSRRARLALRTLTALRRRSVRTIALPCSTQTAIQLRAS